MSNIVAVLKHEIVRLSRKEIRSQSVKVRKASVQYRKDIANLKRNVAGLQKRVSLLEKKTLQAVPAIPLEETNVRFSAKGIISTRKRLNLSGNEYARLVGVATQSVYNWEKGVSVPRKKQIGVIAAIRKMSKKEVRARLEKSGKVKKTRKIKKSLKKK